MISISFMTTKYTQLRNHHAHFHSFLVLYAVSRTISFSTEQVISSNSQQLKYV